MPRAGYFLKGVKRIREIGKPQFKGGGFQQGYAGLTHTALMISEYIPKCITYVEPFAGLGRVAKYVKAEHYVLNDKSDYAFNYLKKHFGKAFVTNNDFINCIKGWDSEATFYLMDPPWESATYNLNPKTYCNMTPKEYYDKIFELLPNLKGNWFVCGNKGNMRLKNHRYYNKLFISRKTINKGNISTLVMSNKPFTRYNQSTLDI